MYRFPDRSFVRVMLSPSLHKLRIPKVFARKYYEELGAYCYLEVPTGVTHRVELKEEDGELWFGDGLKELADAFSIRYGYFLLFNYEGHSNFRVHIYDLTACEISYERSHDSSSLGVSCEEVESETDVGVSSSGSEDLPDEMLDSESGSEPSNDSIAPTFRYFQYSHIPWLRACGVMMRALSKARILVPKNLFFVVSIQKYNLEGCSMIIPLSFAREHLRCTSGDFVRVNVDDGRQWNIQCCMHKLRCILCHGWSGLAQEMHLEIGDVCLFELTDKGNCVFHLHVLKAY
ncbi:hypothetical protein KSS87_004496 [Heliosperma pusillum]|nr:hypothetical protein KSS87_004496 [Heliosperma pusillum]